MRIVRVQDNRAKISYAVRNDDKFFLIAGDIYSGGYKITDERIIPEKILSPVEPAAIICIGLNYKKHAIESNMEIPKRPIVFMKNPAAATGHHQPIKIPAVCGDEVDYECELAVVIGKMCRNVSYESAFDYILGYTCGNDVSARIWQTKKGGGQWVRAKSFDSFAPLGPVLVTKDEISDPNRLDICTRLNGETVQSSNTSDMIFSVPQLVSFLSEDTTLLPGTVIMTGTPAGVGWMKKPRKTLKTGDKVVVEIENIGILENDVE